jgi:hypothetical protein
VRDAFAFVVAIGSASLIAGAGFWCIGEALRSKPPSDEVLERAGMRSTSWPTEPSDEGGSL